MKYINTVFLVLLIIVILMMFSRYILKSGLSKYHEGFTQNERYITMSNCDIYDDFYVSIYDNLNETESRVLHDYKNIIKTIQFDKKENGCFFTQVRTTPTATDTTMRTAATPHRRCHRAGRCRRAGHCCSAPGRRTRARGTPSTVLAGSP